VKRDESSKPLDRFRRRAAQDPFFLGHALGKFASERGFGDGELAEFLGCGVERLPHLMACRSPGPEAQRFAADVRKIAEYAGCKEERLLLALRELSVLGLLRALPSATENAPVESGLLAARLSRNKPPGKTERGHDDDRP
jgi:hypothetical protein